MFSRSSKSSRKIISDISFLQTHHNKSTTKVSLSPRSEEAMATLKDITDWYMRTYYRYIIFYGNIGSPHILSIYVPDRLLIREIAYQTMEIDITYVLSGRIKKLWPTFPINIGRYTLSTGPKNIALDHVKCVGLTHLEIHVVNYEEETFKGVLFFEKVLQMLPNEESRGKFLMEEEEKKKKT